MKTKKMKCKRRNWQGFSRFVTNFLSVQSTLLKYVSKSQILSFCLPF
jgi:hypothetical protein